MIIKSAKLETVCGITSKLPQNTCPEFAFAGKSNVGKSSMILLPAWKDPDHQFLQCGSDVLFCGPSRIWLCEGFRGGKGKMGEDGRALPEEL